MSEIYGDYWDGTKEVRELCLNCKYPDCFGEFGCPERMEIIARKKKEDEYRMRMDGTFTARGKLYEMDGEEKTLNEWARQYGKKYSIVWQRLQKGMSLKDALTAKIVRGGKRNGGKMIEICGEKHCIKDWMEICGVTKRKAERYMREKKCDKVTAVKELCAKKLKRTFV